MRPASGRLLKVSEYSTPVEARVEGLDNAVGLFFHSAVEPPLYQADRAKHRVTPKFGTPIA
jgi:hypothetical protein